MLIKVGEKSNEIKKKSFDSFGSWHESSNEVKLRNFFNH